MKKKYIIKNIIPDAIYTDRHEFIDYFYNAAIKSITRRTKSLVLVGQRRMGKTEIFKRVINKLYSEQGKNDIGCIKAVYYSFRDTPMDKWEFAVDYTENFLRWYTAFSVRDTYILSDAVSKENLVNYIENSAVKKTQGLKIATETFKNIITRQASFPELSALKLPRTISDNDDSTIVMFLDEFQNTHLPQYNFRIAGLMQEVVESPTCPHFVTGSAMSILSHEILGKGSLFGRFRSIPIKPFTKYYGAELAIKAGKYYGSEFSLEMAFYIANRCGGNPFYIDAVVHQAAEQKIKITTEESVNKVLAVDLSSGFIWGELHDQIIRWITRINETGITKWVLYLSVIDSGEKIDPKWIQMQLKIKDNKNVSIDQITDVLIKLSRGDLLEYKEIGGWFKKVDDPILVEFLKIWGQIEVEGIDQDNVKFEVMTRYNRLKRKITEYIGYMAEVYMSQILWNSQNKSLSGKYFHSKKSVINMPLSFVYIRHRVRLGASSGLEVDIYAAGTEIWIGESKYWQDKKVGKNEVQNLIKLSKVVMDIEGREKFEDKNPLKIRLWLYAHNGVTKQALELIKKHDILWSDKNDLDSLIKEIGLRKLSELL